jgi:hypothetical protein
MREDLGKLLNGTGKGIRAGVLHSAQKLFSVAMDAVRQRKGLDVINKKGIINISEYLVTYNLIKDMLKRVNKGIKDFDSELEKLALSIEILTPDGRQIPIARENYQTLCNLFGEMHKESCKYPTAYDGSHSPYSIGTFDDSDE